MILVTQDHYLFQGVKNFFPDIIQLDSSGKAILDNEVDELSLLVDSRSPLCHYDYLVMEAAQSRKRICCIVLDMRHREEHLLSLKSFLNMSLSPADMATLFGLFLEMKSKRLTKEWFD
ncbi:LuxR family transcriptional regulator, partial [Enterobacteriaceae bacterium 8376wD7]|nr:LuxR family transcriptional regulator [Enterobacteriaceae bacterium 8376wD7]